MVSKTFGVTFLLFLISSTFTIGQADMKCKGEDLHPVEAFETVKNDCWKQESPDSATIAEAMQNACVHKCLVLKLGLVDENGEPHEENTVKAVEVMAPANIQSELTPKVVHCVHEYGSKIKEMENSCDSYAAICTCVVKSLKEVCEVHE